MTRKHFDLLATWTLAVLGWLSIALLWPVACIANRLRRSVDADEAADEDHLSH